MGKGDRRTKRGKITKGTFGKSRPHKVKTVTPAKPKAKKASTKRIETTKQSSAPYHVSLNKKP